jgi:AhpD family alkylhydroperoxidase
MGMDNNDKLKIEKIIKDRKKAHGFLIKNSKVYNSIVDLENTTFQDNTISKKNKELIAIGISIILNCESCLEWHIHEALKDGATEHEIIEAMEVGIEMGGGPATVSIRFGLKILEYYKELGI